MGQYDSCLLISRNPLSQFGEEYCTFSLNLVYPQN